jgi:PAS domain S-box-containing protein
MLERGNGSAMRWAGGVLATAGLAALVAGEFGWPSLVHVASVALGATLAFSRRSPAVTAAGADDERFRIVARVTNDAIWDWNLVTGALEWNEGILTLFGYAAEDLTPDIEFWTSRIHPDERERVLSGLYALQASREDAWQEEYRFLRSAGDYAWVLDRGIVMRDAHGRAVRMVGGMTDRTERRRAEDELQRERGFLRALLENLSEGVVACDGDGVLTTFNRATRDFHGLPAEPLPSERWAAHYSLFESDGVTPLRHDDLPLVRALRGEAVQNLEVVIAPLDARRRLVVCNGAPLLSESGELLGAVVAMHDITDRRHAEQLDGGQRAILTGIAARVPLAETLAAVCRLYEIQHPHSICSILLLDAEGTHVRQGAAPSMPAEFNAAIEGEPIGPEAGSCGTAAWRAERVIVHDIDASPLWVKYRAVAGRHGLRACWSTPVLSSAAKVLATFAVYYREPRSPTGDELRAIDGLAAVTAIAIEQDADYRRLMRSEQRFRSLFDEHPDAVYSMDLEGRFTSYNRSFHALSGFRSSDIFGTGFDRRVAPEQREIVRAQFAAAAAGEARTYEAAILLPHDARVEMRITNLPIVEDGKVTGVFGIAHDITERRRAELALQQTFEELRLRNRELQDFAFVASHDLQEPLRKIQAFSDRLKTRHAAQLDLQARDYLDRSAQAAARMQVLIDDLLAYSRVSSRGKPFAPVDLARVAARVVDDLEPRIESSGARVEVGALPTLEGDATQLYQLLQNLLSNALKFRAPGRDPLVRIEAIADTLPGGRAGWELRVTDNGIGFDPKYAERIFAPFQRLHARQDYEGTGIGLAIVRRIVERHRGSIRAEARSDGGATFIVLLPERQGG